MIGNSITVINKSGKVISSGKHLAGVWKEAKAAYRSRKAEIRATRDAEYSVQKTRHALKNVSLSDENIPRRAASHAGSSRSVHRSKTTRRSSLHPDPRPDLARGFTDSTYANDVVYAHPAHPPEFEAPDRALMRRHTSPPRPGSARSYDEHLAYGTLPPAFPIKPTQTEAQLRGEMSKLTQLLDEANCLQYTATAMIEHLQKNPEALAAVGLSLAEISALVRKVGPVALMNLKTAFPAVVALLASPQFLIAGGVAVGVTIVMLGGYKIIKKIKAQKELENEDNMAQLREIETELSQIEVWRRGIAEAKAESVGTTVEGEFITPQAEQRLLDEGVLHPDDLKPLPPRRVKSERSHRSRRPESVRSEGSARRKSNHHYHSHRGSKADDEKSTTSSTKDGKKRKALSGLKLLFQGRS